MYSLHCYTLVGQTNFAVFIVKQHSTKSVSGEMIRDLISGQTLLTSKWNLVINLFVAVISTSVLDT